MPVFCLVTVAAAISVGAGLLAAMYYRDEPFYGAAGMAVLLLAGIPASMYGVIANS